MNDCVKAFQERTKMYKEQEEELNNIVDSNPILKPVTSENTVLWTLHEYAKKYHPLTLGTASPTSGIPSETPEDSCAATESPSRAELMLRAGTSGVCVGGSQCPGAWRQALLAFQHQPGDLWMPLRELSRSWVSLFSKQTQ